MNREQTLIEAVQTVIFKENILMNSSCTNFELYEFFCSPKNVHFKALLYSIFLICFEKNTNENFMNKDFSKSNLQLEKFRTVLTFIKKGLKRRVFKFSI